MKHKQQQQSGSAYQLAENPTWRDQPDLTVQEACTLLQVTAPTIYSLMNRGALLSYKVGRLRRITRESFQALRTGGIKIR
jgi:excisionase family DNA binding protein